MHSFSGLLQCFNCQPGFVNGSRSESRTFLRIIYFYLIPDPDPARIKEQINENFIFSLRPVNSEQQKNCAV